MQKDKKDARVTRLKVTENSYDLWTKIRGEGTAFTQALFKDIEEDELKVAKRVIWHEQLYSKETVNVLTQCIGQDISNLFYPLYNEISKYTRTVVYERPGYGYSEVGNTSRDIDTIAKEMHELLQKSGEEAAYILVGHSLQWRIINE